MAHAHIQKLKAEIAKLRSENPETAALMDENEMLRKAVAEYDRRERSLAGAITKVLGDRGYAGQTDDARLPLGQGAVPGPVGKAVLTQIAANEAAALKDRAESVKKVKPRTSKPRHDMTDGIRELRKELKQEGR